MGDDTIKIANVTIDQGSPFLKSILINKGTKHEITKGMTVFSKNYLIGTVIETNYISSRVLLPRTKKTAKRISYFIEKRKKYFEIFSGKVDHSVDIAYKIYKKIYKIKIWKFLTV